MIDVRYDRLRYEVDEAATAPGVRICIEVTAGVVGPSGVAINVSSIAGGSAEGLIRACRKEGKAGTLHNYFLQHN